MNNALIGNCAVGVVVVDGPAGTSAAFTDSERATINSEVSQGFDVLYTLSKKAPVKPHLIFMTEVKTVKLTLDPKTVPAPTGAAAGSEYEPREAPWRDAALASLGHGAGIAGVEAYANALLAKSWPVGLIPKSAYLVFVTKYNTAWMAYCPKSRRYLVMQYEWLADKTGGFAGTGKKGWGPENFDVVFAHETGHIFGAPDEYASSNCLVTAKFGALNIANGNCQATPTATVSQCLMFNNTQTLCGFTPGHWGWVDANGDGVLDAAP
jgi:predicted ribosomally synthesized peptide with SipW-like signal peptide